MKTQLFADGFEGHVRRSLERARRLQNGERLGPAAMALFERVAAC